MRVKGERAMVNGENLRVTPTSNATFQLPTTIFNPPSMASTVLGGNPFAHEKLDSRNPGPMHG